MTDQEIESRIEELVEEQRRLREQLASGTITPDEGQARLAETEASVDRMWDLLRQRRALREFDEDPDQAKPRPADEVVRYLQ